jgi:Flp pilus assembly pilin Flp
MAKKRIFFPKSFRARMAEYTLWIALVASVVVGGVAYLGNG